MLIVQGFGLVQKATLCRSGTSLMAYFTLELLTSEKIGLQTDRLTVVM
jgi:hypothetical protein